MVSARRWLPVIAAASTWIASTISGFAYAPRQPAPEIPSSPSISARDAAAEPIGSPVFTLDPRMGFFAAGDPINAMDPDGRLASPMRPVAEMSRTAAGALQSYADSTSSLWGVPAAVGAHFLQQGADLLTPSSHVNSLTSAYDANGGGVIGTLAAANVYNPGRPVYNAVTGRDLIYGNTLSAEERLQATLASVSLGSGMAAGVLAETGVNATLIASRPLPIPPVLAAEGAVGSGTGIGPGAAHASEFVTSSAARRAAMREAGIPTSQQPIAQINASAGRQYIYDVNGQRWAVTRQTTDRVAGHGPHWEAGRVKPPGDYGLDPLGRQRVFNDGKVKVDYGAE